MSNHHNHHHQQQNKKISASQTPKIHDSWSSRASSILAKGLSEPKYMSRTEMLEKLAQLSHVQDVAHLEAMTAMIHGNDDEEEEENDVDKRFHEIFAKKNAMEEEERFREIDGAESSSEHSEVSTVKHNRHNHSAGGARRTGGQHSRTDYSVSGGGGGRKTRETDYSGNYSGSECSCESCAMSYSSCSCCEDEEEEEAEAEQEEPLTSLTSSSVETIIEGRDKGKFKHTDMYVVNVGSSDNNLSDEQQYNQVDPIITSIPKNSKVKMTEKNREIEKHQQQPPAPPPPPPPRYSTTPSHSEGGDTESPRVELTRNETRNSKLLELQQQNNSRSDRKSRTKSSKSQKSNWSNTEFTKIYEPVTANEIRRQKNARALKQYLQEFASDWDDRVNHLNTLRRGRVLKELKRNLRETIDLENVKPEDLGDKVVNALRQALDTSELILSNVHIGQMYVPMEENPSNSKAVSRENTDYDTFGSIDSLIFEPKVPTNEAIEEEIESQFDYLNNEFVAPPKKNILGPGRTTFAERVKMFNNLSEIPKAGGGATNWQEVAIANKRLATLSLESQKHSSRDTESICPDCLNLNSAGSQGVVGGAGLLQQPLESILCSTCDNCTQCGNSLEDDVAAAISAMAVAASEADADRSDGQVYSGQPESHQSEVVAEVHQEHIGQSDFNIEDPSREIQITADENQLRRQLKQAFGHIKSSKSNSNLPPKNKMSSSNQHLSNSKQSANDKAYPIYEPISDLSEHNVEYDVDFLSEYAKKTSLYHVEIGANNAPIISKAGQTMAVTEDLFRGEFSFFPKTREIDRSAMMKKSSKDHHHHPHDDVIADHLDSAAAIAKHLNFPPNSNHHQPSRNQKGSSPELNNSDSGIASPPPDEHELSMPMTMKLNKVELTTTTTTEEEEVVMPIPEVEVIPEINNPETGNDSGMDENEKSKSKVIAGKQKQPDTMIRELKFRLKEKFQHDEIVNNAELKNKSNSKTKSATKQEDYILKNGTVESRKLAMESQFAKMIANNSKNNNNNSDKKPHPNSKKSNSNVVTILSTTTDDNKSNGNRPILTTWSSKSQQTSTTNLAGNSNISDEDDLCSDCGEPFEHQHPTPPPKSNIKNPSSGGHTNRPPTREMLYAPGGLFGPKGPFSTPHVRYPNGMELPPRKPSRAPSRVSGILKNTSMNPYSELGSIAGAAEDRSVKSSYTMNAVIMRPFSPEMSISGGGGNKPPSRMETYKADWSELPYEDLDRWQEEKAKRMLAWIHTLQGSEHIGAETPWWKVI